MLKTSPRPACVFYQRCLPPFLGLGGVFLGLGEAPWACSRRSISPTPLADTAFVASAVCSFDGDDDDSTPLAVTCPRAEAWATAVQPGLSGRGVPREGSSQRRFRGMAYGSSLAEHEHMLETFLRVLQAGRHRVQATWDSCRSGTRGFFPRHWLFTETCLGSARGVQMPAASPHMGGILRAPFESHDGFAATY